MATGFIAAAGCCMVAAAAAHGDDVRPVPAKVGGHAGPITASLAPIAARYRVTISRRDASKRMRSVVETWTFERTERRITLVRGDIEEHWMRDERGTVRFERVFHADQRVVDYTAGELATLGIDVSWDGLATFVDARELATLERVGESRATQRYSGKAGSRSIAIEWSPQAGLPARLTRVSANGRAQFELLESHASAPASWPVAGVRSADYLHVDAADFGDMEYDAFVRKAEAFDVMAGWRKPHAHD